MKWIVFLLLIVFLFILWCMLKCASMADSSQNMSKDKKR